VDPWLKIWIPDYNLGIDNFSIALNNYHIFLFLTLSPAAPSSLVKLVFEGSSHFIFSSFVKSEVVRD